jgi:Skp family chaperone for outer membrane proteins
MKTKKLISTLQSLLDGDKRESRRQQEELQRLLEELEQKESKFQYKLASAATDDEREKYQRKIAIVAAQREKGNQALAEIEGG